MLHRFSLPAALLLVSISTFFVGCTQTGYTVDRKTVNGLPTVTATDYSQAKAKVDAIDYSNRSIALTGPDGKTQIFYVTPAVRNFSQIKKGDTVKVEYASKLVATVRKVNTPPTSEFTNAVERADLGQKPGVTCTRQARIEANVESIDLSTRNLKLKTTTGEILSITADPRLKDLDKVHVGDQVVFEYAEAVSINVE